jgi:hypothetical protein
MHIAEELPEGQTVRLVFGRRGGTSSPTSLSTEPLSDFGGW